MTVGRRSSIFFKEVIHCFVHRQKAAATACLGFLNIVFSATLTNQLMIHTNSTIFEIQIFSGQTAELADSHTGFQKHHELIVVFAVGVVFLNEIHPDSQVFLSECSSRHRIIDHHIRQLKDERILSDGILITRHLKCGFDNTSYTADGAKTSAILL